MEMPAINISINHRHWVYFYGGLVELSAVVVETDGGGVDYFRVGDDKLSLFVRSGVVGVESRAIEVGHGINILLYVVIPSNFRDQAGNIGFG